MRIGRWAHAWGIAVIPAEEFGPVNPGDTVYRIKDIFTTRDGSWEPSNKTGTVEQWARDAYLKPINHPQYNDDGGADHNVFGAIVTGDRLVPDMPFAFWTGDGQNNVERNAKKHGWANIPIWSLFYPDQRQKGAWLWNPHGVKADVVANAGLPDNLHVSWWGVWEPKIAEGPVVVVPDDGPEEPLPTDEQLDKAFAALEAAFERFKAAYYE